MVVSRTSSSPITVRTRRAYFDCKFGQLHVRTAFPTTGGFDEQVTLFCLHAIDASSRTFSRLLPQLADVRSVYAPDLPGFGESDPSPASSTADAAIAVSDLANGSEAAPDRLVWNPIWRRSRLGTRRHAPGTGETPDSVRRSGLGTPGPSQTETSDGRCRALRQRSVRHRLAETGGRDWRVPRATPSRLDGATQQVHQRDRCLFEA